MKLTRNALGNAIRAARDAAGLSQEELAGKVGISPVHLKHIEGGSRKPSVDVLFRIMEQLHLSVDSLVFEDQKPVSQTYLKASQMLQAGTEKELNLVISTLEALREANN